MSSKSFSLLIKNKISPFSKTIEVDSDKSISIRSFLIAAISQNISSVSNVLESEDVLSTINCLKNLGLKIKKKSKKNYLIYGKGLGSLFIRKNTNLNPKSSSVDICLKLEKCNIDTISDYLIKLSYEKDFPNISVRE